MSATEPLLAVRDLVLTAVRGEQTVRLVDEVSLDLYQGDALGIVGESGSGKSLTLRALLGLLPPGVSHESGTVSFAGRDIDAISGPERRRLRGRHIGMIFQDPMTALNPVMTVGDQIAEGPRAHLGLSRRGARRRAVELMDEVGIPSPERRAHAYPHEFSGGMRQRVMIAIALSSKPSLLLCDEPTTALDVTIQEQILAIIRQLQGSGNLSVIFVTHDLAVVAQLCERVAVMYSGQIVETGSTAAVFGEPRHAYTLGLLRSAPDLHVARTRLATIPGLPPDPARLPPGCRFAERCSLTTAECDSAPELRVHPDGRATRCIHADQVERAALAEPVVGRG